MRKIISNKTNCIYTLLPAAILEFVALSSIYCSRAMRSTVFFLSCLLIWLYWIEITVFWAAKAENKSNRIEKSWKFHEVHFDEKSLTSPSLFVCFIIETLEMSLFIKPFIHSCFPVHSISNSDKKKNIESNRQQKMNETIEREEHS